MRQGIAVGRMLLEGYIAPTCGTGHQNVVQDREVPKHGSVLDKLNTFDGFGHVLGEDIGVVKAKCPEQPSYYYRALDLLA
ncbi:hypothetical protein Ancab_019654, partial [Ancistrocladus abbreviatus]